MVFSFLKSLDILGHKYTFTVGGKYSFQTILGGFLSMSIFLIWAALFYIFGQSYFHKRDPFGYSHVKNEDNPPGLDLKNTPFLMGFQIYYDDLTTFNSSEYFHTFFMLREAEFIGKKLVDKRKLIKAKTCDKVKIPKKYNTTGYDMSTFLCPDFEEGMVLKGSFDQVKFTSLEFIISLCDEKNSNCKDQKKIKNLIDDKRKWISTLSPMISYNIDDYDKPLHLIMHNHYTLFRVDKHLYQQFHYAGYDSITDRGDIFENLVEKFEIGLHEVFNTQYSKHLHERIIYREKEDFIENSLYHGSLFYTNKRYFYRRWYLKIPDILANTFGVISGLRVIFSIIFLPYFKYNFSNYLFKNKLFVDEESLETKRELRKYFEFESKKKKIFDEESSEDFTSKLSKRKSRRISLNPTNPLNPDGKDRKKTLQQLQSLAGIEMIREIQDENDHDNDNVITGKNAKENDSEYNENDFNELYKESRKTILKKGTMLKRNNTKFSDEQIKTNLQKKIDKYNNRNTNRFNYFVYLKNWFCPKRYKNVQTYNYYDLLDIVGYKFNKKLDIFTYLENSTNVKYLDKFLFSGMNKNVLKLILKKSFRINIHKNGKVRIMKTQKNMDEEILDFLMKGDQKLGADDELIINGFIG